jgi:hypothetical protein
VHPAMGTAGDMLTRHAPLHLAVATVVALLAGPSWGGSSEERNRAAGLSRGEKEDFLRTAEIVDRQRLAIGVTGSERATLSDGRLTHDAHIQTVNVLETRYRTHTQEYLFFRDSYRYNIAAYQLDVLMGLGMVPVSVERQIGKQKAAVTWWVDDVLMMETDRIRSATAPPEYGDWLDQFNQARIFTQLIHNSDFNPGNLLISRDWRLWLIDFTRAFRATRSLPDEEGLKKIDRRLYEGMRRLDRETLQHELRPYLSKREITTLLARRDLIVSHYEEQIAEKGAAAVICSRSGH